jgi:DNA-binding transcriptional ArsR family regulator
MAIETDETWTALVDPTRRRIVELLAEGPMRAGAVADSFPSTGPTISRHLSVLKRAGLIEVATVGDDARVKLYRLRRQPFGDITAWLDQVQAHWRDQLDAFAQHAEETRKKDGQ